MRSFVARAALILAAMAGFIYYACLLYLHAYYAYFNVPWGDLHAPFLEVALAHPNLVTFVVLVATTFIMRSWRNQQPEGVQKTALIKSRQGKAWLDFIAVILFIGGPVAAFLSLVQVTGAIHAGQFARASQAIVFKLKGENMPDYCFLVRTRNHIYFFKRIVGGEKPVLLVAKSDDVREISSDTDLP